VQPETKYARLGGDRIAYQLLGNGPPDLVLVLGSFGHLDIGWKDPGSALFLRTLASFCRLILFDRRGMGASDPLPPDPLPPWESYADELAAVLDEVGSQRAATMGHNDTGPTALFRRDQTGTHQRPCPGAHLCQVRRRRRLPNRAARIGHGGALGRDRPPVGYRGHRCDDGAQQSRRRAVSPLVREAAAHQCQPRVIQVLLRAALAVDVRPILPLIQAPTLILHRKDVQILSMEHSRYLAAHIPQARLVELPGADAALMWEMPELVLDLIKEFLTGVRRAAEPTRVLTTVLFTDIVGSTQQASRLGDRRWRERLNLHDELAGRLLEEFGGRLVKTTGDGVLATFDGPGRRDTLRRRAQRRTGWHRATDSGGAAHRRGGAPRPRRRRRRGAYRGPGHGRGRA
jgi:pimeloyl-ACP methyl ester carboxylesterase